MANTKWRWTCRFNLPDGSFYALERCVGQSAIRFWHRAGRTWTCFYEFLPDGIYHVSPDWTAQRCAALEAELRRSGSSLSVLRFAVDGQFLVPPEARGTPVPPPPLRSSLTKKQRQALEVTLGSKPTPVVLFGKFDGVDKEYAWWLRPNAPLCRGICPGDRVQVWAKNACRIVTVTRLMPFDGSVIPTARVRKKLPSRP